MKSSTVVLVVVIGSVLCFLLAVCVLCGTFVFVSNQAGSFDFGLPPQTGRLAPDFQLESIGAAKWRNGGSVAFSTDV